MYHWAVIQEARARITVTVLNENDNNPEFSKTGYSLTAVSDEEMVGQVRASDPDQSDDGITYSIIQSEYR